MKRTIHRDGSSPVVVVMRTVQSLDSSKSQKWHVGGRARWLAIAFPLLLLVSGLPATGGSSQNEPAQAPPEPQPFQEEPPAPDLGVYLPARMEAGANTAHQFQLVFFNAGNAPASEATGSLETTGGGRRDIQTFQIPALQAGAEHELSVSVPLDPGLNRVAATIRGSGQTQGSESNDHATTWIRREDAQPAEVPNPLRFERADGTPVPGPTPTFKATAGRLVIEGSVPVEATAIIVHEDWLESRVRDPGLKGRDFGHVARDGAQFLQVPVEAGEDMHLTFASFRPSTEHDAYGRGSLDTLLFDERPMQARVVAVPDYTLRFRTVETPNGTVEIPEPPQERLSIDLSDGNPSGQTLWISAEWLASHQIRNPLFAHDDGTPILAKRIGDHFLVRPTHFSVIHTFNDNPDPFELVSDQTNSAVHYDSANDRIRIVASRVDTLDESMVRDFIPHAEYLVEGTFGLVDRGKWQGVYPLAVGNRAERTAPDPNHHDFAAKSIGFFYSSGNKDVPSGDPGYLPTIQAYYATPTGSRVVIWTWEGPPGFANPEAPVRLQIRADTTLYALSMIDDLGLPVKCGLGLCVGSVLKSELPVDQYDAIFVGTEEMEGEDFKTMTVAWLDDVKVEMIRPNYIDEEFVSDDNLIIEGSASCCANGVLELTPATPNQLGRAIYTASVTATRFSAEFRYRIGPDASGGQGMVFMFNKNHAYVPRGAGYLGFEDFDSTTILGHEGFGVELDGQLNAAQGDSSDDHMSVLKDRANNQVWSFDGYQHADGDWHTVTVEAFGPTAYIYHDGAYVVGRVDLSTIDYEFSRLGFAASTGAVANYHQVDYVKVSVANPLDIGAQRDVSLDLGWWLETCAIDQGNLDLAPPSHLVQVHNGDETITVGDDPLEVYGRQFDVVIVTENGSAPPDLAAGTNAGLLSAAQYLCLSPEDETRQEATTGMPNVTMDAETAAEYLQRGEIPPLVTFNESIGSWCYVTCYSGPEALQPYMDCRSHGCGPLSFNLTDLLDSVCPDPSSCEPTPEEQPISLLSSNGLGEGPRIGPKGHEGKHQIYINALLPGGYDAQHPKDGCNWNALDKVKNQLQAQAKSFSGQALTVHLSCSWTYDYNGPYYWATYIPSQGTLDNTKYDTEWGDTKQTWRLLLRLQKHTDTYPYPVVGGDNPSHHVKKLATTWVREANKNGDAMLHLWFSMMAETANNKPDLPAGALALHEITHQFSADHYPHQWGVWTCGYFHAHGGWNHWHDYNSNMNYCNVAYGNKHLDSTNRPIIRSNIWDFG